MASAPVLLLFVLPLTAASSQHVKGIKKQNACECSLDFSAWDFPVQTFERVEEVLHNCTASMGALQAQIDFSDGKVPKITETLQNITRRVQHFEYLNKKSLYNALHFRLLEDELKDLETHIQKAHKNQAIEQSKTKELTDELRTIRQKVQGMQKFDKFNLLALREHLRTLKNRVESSISIDINDLNQCSKGLLSNISSALVTQLSPYGKSYPYGSWGKETMAGSKEIYWVQPLTSGNKHGNVLRTYPSSADFMFSKNHQDFTVMPSYSSTNAIQGPGTILYDGALYYNCYNTGNLCKYDLKTQTIINAPLPDAGYNNKFPYCYYNCYDFTDIDFAADETGLWVIYTTENNYGNMVLSKLNSTLGVIQTFRTRLFKKSVTNTFMACGLLYATRYISSYQEEVFYAFDTVTGRENNALHLPFEKVSDRIQNLHYNPTDQRLYLYNDAYMMAYKLYF